MDLDQIIRRARAGDEAALSALCAHFHPVLCRFFGGLLRSQEGAEDLAQESLIAMLRGIDTYRSLPGKRFEGWVMRLSYNKFLDLKRKRTDMALPESYDAPDPGGGIELGFARAEQARAVRGAIDALDPELRDMVTMRYELDMHYADIAAALNTSQPRVKWRLNDALKKLKRTLEKEGIEWTN